MFLCKLFVFCQETGHEGHDHHHDHEDDEHDTHALGLHQHEHQVSQISNIRLTMLDNIIS